MALFGRETDREQRKAEAWATWFRAQNPYAIASLVFGIFSLIEFGVLLIFGIIGIALGVVALRQIRSGSDPDRANGARLAWAGIVTSVLSLVIAILLYQRVFG
jgi:hypothetical protein